MKPDANHPEQTEMNKSIESAILAAGCFWGVEQIFKDIPGVLSTEVGYIGGTKPNPSYEEVCTGRTGHAEAIRITFNPTLLKYSDLLEVFFRMHDPTTLNRQHNDIGTQYRSTIFYNDQNQKMLATEKIKEINDRKIFKKDVATTLEAATEFYSAEAYHQAYLEKNPGGYNCHILRNEI